MRLPMLAVLVMGCAGPTKVVRGTEEIARVYGFSEAKTQAMVRELFEARGNPLLPTDSPHLWMTLPKQDTTENRTLLGGKPTNDPLYTHERTWLVSFEPINQGATAVRVLRGEQLVWANAAERGFTLHHTNAAATTTAGLPLPFVRDHEVEAVVAAELDDQVAVEVTTAEDGSPSLAPVPPLEDPEVSPAAAALVSACPLNAADLSTLLAPGHFVLLSDPLGANEPWVVLDGLVCEAGLRHLPLTVALSIPSNEQASINTFLASDGSPADRQALLTGHFWSRPWQDGRSSVAVVDALERLRQRRAQGFAVTVLAIDTDAPGNARSAHITSKLLRSRQTNPNRAVISLLGNAQSTRRVGAEWNPEALPVGARLAAVLPASTHALDVSFWQGTHWTCHLEDQGRIRCGTWVVSPGPAQVSRALTPRPFIRVFDRVSSAGFDGVYFAGTLTASPPVLEQLRVDQGKIKLRAPIEGINH